MYCLWCHTAFIEKVSWEYVFGRATTLPICQQCSGSFKEITGEICDKCGRTFSGVDPQYRHGQLCHDCVRWGDGGLVKNRSVFVYNSFLQEVIGRWKYRGDAELVKLFWPKLQILVKQFETIDAVVPIPLSPERLYERSFNQAQALAEGLPYPIVEAIIRPIGVTKQSKKSRQQRLHQEDRFQIGLVPASLCKGKSLLLVDDIYTTGATLYSAAAILKQHGAAAVYSITVARG
ncbi:ComF family protein [Anaerobacillus sp. CMMVII]|uniref:ComF family protein n=1 Tax=Anaerobacillus sp. CMMVII TaxID=2755588 RepID=UPI0021B711C6|nr:ComF family protein [Anaerobacillus sp. CMMVII]MCT8140142.1 ComF family protein [Anaerobacillus sp. CMMVII]